MKIHHITEAPRIEPNANTRDMLRALGGSNSEPKVSTSPKLTGVTGTKAAFANKNGGVSKGTIVGPAANGNPNQVSFKDSKGKTFNVSVKKLLDPKKLTPLNINSGTSTSTTKTATKSFSADPSDRAGTAPKTDTTPKSTAPLSKRDQKRADWNKKSALSKGGSVLKKMGKWGGIMGVLSTITGIMDVADRADNYVKVLDRHDGNIANPKVITARAAVHDAFTGAIIALMGSIATGAVAAGAATRILVVFPGLGWLIPLLAGGVGWLIGHAFNALAKDAALVNSLSEFAITRLTDEWIETIGESSVNEDNATAAKTEIKSNMLNLIKSDPKMMKAFKIAKQQKAKSTAS
jgi:hypothetical protein